MDDDKKRDEITLTELIALVWQQKWLVIAIVVVCATGSLAYAKLATEWWRADALLAPAEHKNGGLAGSLGGLAGIAGLAGINLDNENTAEPVALLQSPGFIGSFIEEQNLLPVLFADRWDPVGKSWTGSREKWPDVRDGIRMFQRKILTVTQDPKTQLISVTIVWTDPVLATRWANMLVDRVNSRMRDRALQEADRNVTYLRQELGRADVVTLQESVAHLLESEMQKMMLARGNMEYSFHVIDRASVPKWRDRPKRLQVVILGTAAGIVIAVFLAAVVGRRRRALDLR